MRRRALSSGLNAHDQFACSAKDSMGRHELQHDAIQVGYSASKVKRDALTARQPACRDHQHVEINGAGARAMPAGMIEGLKFKAGCSPLPASCWRPRLFGLEAKCCERRGRSCRDATVLARSDCEILDLGAVGGGRPTWPERGEGGSTALPSIAIVIGRAHGHRAGDDGMGEPPRESVRDLDALAKPVDPTCSRASSARRMVLSSMPVRFASRTAIFASAEYFSLVVSKTTSLSDRTVSIRMRASRAEWRQCGRVCLALLANRRGRVRTLEKSGKPDYPGRLVRLSEASGLKSCFELFRSRRRWRDIYTSWSWCAAGGSQEKQACDARKGAPSLEPNLRWSPPASRRAGRDARYKVRWPR